MREHSTGTYSTTAYFLSKTLVELPLAFAQCLLQFTLTYWLMGMRGDFLTLVSIGWLLSIATASIGLVVASAVTSATAAAEVSPAVFVPQFLFAGFFVRTEQIPVWVRWSQWLCGIKYAVNVALITEFDPELDSCQGKQSCPRATESNHMTHRL
jgi:ABC-type multidrug transport system permease subunit